MTICTIRNTSGKIKQAHFLGFGDTNRSHNFSQTTKPSDSQQKKKKRKKGTSRIVDFAVPADHKVKLRGSEKCDKYQDLARELETVELESDGDTNFDWCTRYSYKRTDTGTGELEKERTNGDHLNSSFVEIGQNTEKSPRDLK